MNVMTTLESMIAAAGEAPLADSLDFSLPPASTSVVDRRQHVRAYPTSASTLTPTTTRTVRIRLGGDEFINPASVRIQYTIVNCDGTNPLTPLTGPWGMRGQVYERSGGVEIANIPNYGRFHQQYGWNQLSMAEQLGEAGLCGIGGSWGNGGVGGMGGIIPSPPQRACRSEGLQRAPARPAARAPAWASA